MAEVSENWALVIRSRSFILGTAFLSVLFLIFFWESSDLATGQLFFGILFLLLLGGFFMYIYTPPLIRGGRELLTGAGWRMLPPIGVSIVFTVYRVINPVSTEPLVTLFQITACFIFVLTPSLLYSSFPNLTKNGLSIIDIISVLWVWMPIEFGAVEDFIGKVEIGIVPFETLLALFALMYALIFIRNHDLGLTFAITIEDLITVGKATAALIFIILPLGMLSYFLGTPDVIIANFLAILEGIPDSLIDAILTFVLIFLVIALTEEMLFRGVIQKLVEERFKEDSFSSNWWYGGLLALVVLIIITPWVDNVLQALSERFPVVTYLRDTIGSMADPLGVNEGKAWPLVENVPIELLYVAIAIILGVAGLVLIYKTRDPVIAALVLSSILFGWAHFEDVRYLFFASIAGYAYGWTYWKTEKIVPAALVHMLVDGVWSLLLSF
ncbi:MAG: lysostaphin resistance A-like protein [Candidatus Odinarchaeota archaeon]